MSIRAVSGCVRMSDEIEVSVLNRKCGLIWLARASILAASRSFSCSCRRCSMRALFQILMGVATARTVASRMTVIVQNRTGRQVEQPVMLAPARAERPVGAARGQSARVSRSDLPVHLEAADHAPGASVEAGEDEWREVPDRFLGTQLAQAAAGESAADGEGEGDDLAVEDRGQAGHRADGRAGVGSGDQTCQERAFQAQVGCVVIQQEPGGDAAGRGHAERQGEDQPVRPVAAFEDQDVAKAPIPDEHRGQGGHHGQLDDQRREQHLIGGEECRSRHVMKAYPGPAG